MADIAMCLNNNCPSSAICKRHENSGTRVNEYRQSYMDFKPDESGKCGDFWEVKK